MRCSTTVFSPLMKLWNSNKNDGNFQCCDSCPNFLALKARQNCTQSPPLKTTTQKTKQKKCLFASLQGKIISQRFRPRYTNPQLSILWEYWGKLRTQLKPSWYYSATTPFYHSEYFKQNQNSFCPTTPIPRTQFLENLACTVCTEHALFKNPAHICTQTSKQKEKATVKGSSFLWCGPGLLGGVRSIL